MNSPNPDHSPILITRHAIERARQRLGWSARSLHRMAVRVLAFGFSVGDVAGALSRYMGEKEAVAGAFARSYGEHLFIFKPGDVAGELSLITVWQLPGELRGLLRRARGRLTSK